MFQKAMDSIQSTLEKTLTKGRIRTRPKAGPGIWLSLLVPSAVLIGCLTSKKTTSLYLSCAIFSFNLLLNILHLLYHVTKYKSLYVTKGLNLLCAIPVAFTVFFYVTVLKLDFVKSLCHSLANALLYFEGLPFILKVFPQSFTFGEANIILHGLSLFIYSSFLRLNQVVLIGVSKDSHDIATTILQVGLLGILLLCAVAYSYSSIRRVIPIYMLGIAVVFGCILAPLHYILGYSPLLWVFSFLVDKQRIHIVLLWLACSVIAGVAIGYQINDRKQASPVVRKYFHILATIVFLSGILTDVILLYLASGVIFAIFIVLEAFRLLKLPPLHNFLQNGFSVYADEKDAGSVALTPLYLLVGCSLPLWLHPTAVSDSGTNYLPLLSGVLSIGIGDTCASISGKVFGKHRWQGSKKTVEGTIGCVLGQISLMSMLISFEYIPNLPWIWGKSLAAISAVSLIEAKTDQVDNIVLPLVMYCILVL